jgi:hypothetical protein
MRTQATVGLVSRGAGRWRLDFLEVMGGIPFASGRAVTRVREPAVRRVVVAIGQP